MKNYYKEFIERLDNEEIKSLWKNNSQVKTKFFDFFYSEIITIENPIIVEFGVRHGISTSMFLDICELKNGKLHSIDVNDYSYKFNSRKWNFIKSRDDNFNELKKKIPDDVDVIFLDTVHKAEHVIKIILNYFFKLKVGGKFIIDDISWTPYLKNKKLNHFFKEINNKETFDSLLQLYTLNNETIDVKFNLTDTGCALITKLNNKNLFYNNKTIHRQFTFKNFLRKIAKLFL